MTQLMALSSPDTYLWAAGGHWWWSWWGDLSDVQHWLRNEFLILILWVTGAVLASRVVNVLAARVTARIDFRSSERDALAQSEMAKHRAALSQVIRYIAIGSIWIFTLIAVLNQVLPGSTLSLAVPATVVGAAAGFGAQRIVQDFLAGFFIITERQYGYGDVIEVTAAGTSASGTVEDVTLRVTKLRTTDGEVVTFPNGQIIKTVNLSRDWARAVVDVPVPVAVDVGRVNEILRAEGEKLYKERRFREVLLDEPTVMGVVSLEVDQLTIQMIARTLPGQQYVVARALRARIARAFLAEGIRFEDIPAPKGGGDGEGRP